MGEHLGSCGVLNMWKRDVLLGSRDVLLGIRVVLLGVALLCHDVALGQGVCVGCSMPVVVHYSIMKLRFSLSSTVLLIHN